MINKKDIQKFLDDEVKPVFIESYTTSDNFNGMVHRIESNSFGELFISDAVDKLGGYTNNYTELATIEAYHDNNIDDEEIETVALNDWYEYKQDQLIAIIEKVVTELNKDEMFNMLYKMNDDNWDEEPYKKEDGKYYIKNMLNDEYLLKDAYNYELNQALENIECFNKKLQEEISECKEAE